MNQPSSSPALEVDPKGHRDFLNRYYGISRYFYDLTRKYYLFGRDRALRQLAAEPGWTRLIEIGSGTGRNLRKLRRMRPDASLGGVEASDAMIEHARTRCPGMHFVRGFAEEVDYSKLLGAPPQRIIFSYSLSMIQQPVAALDQARRMVAPGGDVIVVDFADLEGLPSSWAAGLRAWLRTFHVNPIEHDFIRQHARKIEYGPGRYYLIARL
ncbi:MAG: class I SAM-dependent methyltransferase [Myxococcota bacterium]